jgi:hypothetical protein
MSNKNSVELELSKFNPKILEKKRKNGHAPIIVFLGKRGCLEKDTPVIMYNHSTKMVQDVIIGDILMGPDGKPRKVLKLYTGRSVMYKIKQNGGDDYVVNDSHILTLMDEDEIIDIPIEEYISIRSTRHKLRGYRVSNDFCNKIPIEIDIEELPEDDYYGFGIDGNHRFLLGDYTVTHNSGKCLGKDTPVIMNSGKTKMVQDIKVGDLLMGDDSKSRKVLNLSTGRSKMYKINQKKGYDYVVNENHVLSLKVVDTNTIGRPLNLLGKKYNRGDFIDVSIKDYLKFSKYTRKRHLKGYKVPIDLPEKDLPIDPYLLGLWLGDGTSTETHITNQDSTVIKYLIEKVSEYDCYLRFSSGYRYSINGCTRKRIEGTNLTNPDNYFLNFLREFNLLNNKHIPDLFKYNSRENRLKLLAGLIDSDGHLEKTESNNYDIIQKNYGLSKDIEFLTGSLGFSGSIKKCNKSCQTGVVGTYYRLNISGKGVEEIPCLIPRKKAIPSCNNVSLCTEIEVEELPVDDYYGFEVDGNHRFLLGDFTVTHNSTLVSDILYYLQECPVVVCMSGTEDGNGYYSQHIHDLCIHNKFDPDVMSGIVNRQKRAVKDLNARGEDPKEHPEIGVGILMDDLAYDKKMMKDPSIREIFFNGRHYHIMTMLTFQYMMDMGPSYRSNVDYVFVCKENKKDNIDKLYKYFFGIFEKPADFRKVLYSCTNDFGCLVLDNTSRSNKIEDQVFWYKAKMNRKYKIGSPEMWRLWDKQLRDEDSDSDDEKEKSFGQAHKKSDMVIKKRGMRSVD